MGIEESELIEMPVVSDPQGDLAVAEAGQQVPFDAIARVYRVDAVPAGAARGGHAHRKLRQMILGVNGRVEVVLDDGRQRKTIAMDHPRQGLYLPPMVWHDLTGFAPGTSYVVLASDPYDEADYLRDYDEFRREALRAATAP